VAGLKRLADVKALAELALRFTEVKDADLTELAALKQLRELDATFTKVTAAGSASLKQTMPSLTIKR
jgi:hypothetical protein